MNPSRYALSLWIATFSGACLASCGWSHIDHEWSYSASGPWNPNTYRSLVGALVVADIGGAVWEGSDTRLGRTLWQGIDSVLLSSAAEEAGKRVFTRARPGSGSDPCMWFQGGSHYSFPSGEAAVAAGLVAPYIIEYARDDPVVYSLMLLPLYVGAARIKNQAHWQSDVIAGWAVGGVSGWYAHHRDAPLTVSLLPRGVSIGIRKRF